jgi:hypothetical protein
VVKDAKYQNPARGDEDDISLMQREGNSHPATAFGALPQAIRWGSPPALERLVHEVDPALRLCT